MRWLDIHCPSEVPPLYGGGRRARRVRTVEADIAVWNPAREQRRPDPAVGAAYDRLYGLYRDLYPATRTTAHALARLQREG
ncbi:hypothetical protein GCM10009574_096340 [Streptomyces asiaticus]|uniref:DUF5753 domain-containing protein n=2 Tax=Streptomyces rhizosphaericus TaxID=114699 RepID=A0ABN1RID2_9ACTN